MENKNYPKRNFPRLKEYDYSAAGTYFVTICTAERKRILSAIPEQSACTDDGVGATSGRPFSPILTKIGKETLTAIEKIPTVYPNIQLDSYVIMPNHVHIILTLNGRPMGAPTLGRVINHFKGCVSKRVGKSIWQKSFYEHIIRDSSDYDEKMKYVYDNPMRWHYDELY